MKRAAISFAALLASAGCVVHSSPPAPLATVTFYWQFSDANGTYNCASAGVAQVRITIDQQVTTVPCSTNGVEGIQLKDFNAGTYSYTLEGLDSSSVARYEDQGSVVVGGRGTDSPVHSTLVALAGPLDIYYAFNGGTDCSAAGVAYIYYNLLDASGTTVSYSDSTNAVPCSTASHGIEIPSLPYGNYTLRWIQGVDGSGAAVYQSCGVAVTHNGTPTNVNMALATGTCP